MLAIYWSLIHTLHYHGSFFSHLLLPCQILPQPLVFADDKVSLAVERMQMMARLTNAISLQKQLINGTVVSDKLISELLHFGSISPSQIHALKSADVISALELLKSLPSKLTAGINLETLQNSYERMGEILKTLGGIKNVTKWPEKESFTTDINNLADGNGGNFSLVKTIRGVLIDWLFGKELVDNIYKAKTYINSSDAMWLGYLVKQSERILEVSKTLSRPIPKLFDFSNNKTAAESVEFLRKVVIAVEEVYSHKFYTPRGGFQELDAHLTKINNVVKAIKTVRLNFDVITNLFISRAIGETSYTHIPTNGYDDISRLMRDFNNPWFVKTVKDKRLEESLRSIKSLETANVIGNALVSKGSSDQKTDCGKAISEDFDGVGVTKLVETAEEIEEKLNEPHKILEILKINLTDMNLLKSMENIVQIGNIFDINDNETYQPAFEEFKKIALDDTNNFLDVLKSESYKIVNSDNLKVLANDTKQYLGDFGPFLTKQKAPLSMLNCLISRADTKPTVKAITESKKIRYSATYYEEKVDNALEVLELVESTKKDLKMLEMYIKNIKNFKSPESDLLFTLNNDTELSKTIGSSANAIGGMKKAIDAKDKINAVKADFGMVVTEANNAKNLPVEDKKNLNALAALGTLLGPMFDELDSWNSGVSGLTFNSLHSYGKIFLKAKDVHGINLDIMKIRKSLIKLIDEVTDRSKQKKLRKVNDGLGALDGMGTQFSSYVKSFDEATSSLESLEKFFSTFAKSISLKSPTQSEKIVYVKEDNLSHQNSAEGTPAWIIVLIIIISILVLGVIAFAVWRFYWKPKNELSRESCP
ncbi:unnamed protein product [Caenorhabditis nigoni]